MINLYREKFNKSIKSVSIVLILSLLFSIAPIKNREANAQWIVWNPSQDLKEFVLDTILYKIIDLIIQRVAASTVNWINSGFRGSPAFVTNPETYLANAADQAAGEFIQKNTALGFLCGPISARIRLALSENYTGRNTQWSCTLTDAVGNMEDFMNDFERGGWEKFFLLTQERQNNPIGAYIQAEGELARQIANRLSVKQQELSWGKGFLSFKTCDRIPPESSASTDPVLLPIGDPVIDASGEVRGQNLVNAAAPTGCIPGTERTTTPGAVIEDQLGGVLKIGSQKLAVADEINEIISALLNQLVNRIIGGVGAGLRALSRPDSSNNNSVFTNSLTSPASDALIQSHIQNSEANLNREANRPEYEENYCENNPTAYGCPPANPVIIQTCDPNIDPNCATAPTNNTQIPSCPSGDFQCLFCRDNPNDSQCRQGINNSATF